MEQSLKNSAFEMLTIVFDQDATEDEVAMAATTLVEIVAPEILEDSIRKYKLSNAGRVGY